MTGLLGIGQLQPHMVLADDLRAYNGRLLMPKDLSLSAQHIRVMKMWGVVGARIKHAAPDQQSFCDDASAMPAPREPLERQVRDRFSGHLMDHPAISTLYRCAVSRFAEHEPLKTPKAATAKKEAGMRKTGVSLTASTVAGGIFDEPFWDDAVLPTLPDIFFKINSAIMNPSSSSYDIASVIGKDTGLSARLLKMANSAFYGFPSQIDSIQRAVTIIGAKQLTTLSYAMNIIDVFMNIPEDILDMASFWRHSVACGICSRILAGYKNIQNTERLFVAGLLHDIGRLLLYQYASDDMGPLVVRARSEGSLLHRLEYENLKVDHTTVGACLVKKWKLPAMLEDIVHFHHTPRKSINGIETTIVHIADIMTNAMGVGSSGESLVPPLDLQAWEMLGLSEHTLTGTIQQMDQQMKDVFNIFFPDEKTFRKYH